MHQRCIVQHQINQLLGGGVVIIKPTTGIPIIPW